MAKREMTPDQKAKAGLYAEANRQERQAWARIIRPVAAKYSTGQEMFADREEFGDMLDAFREWLKGYTEWRSANLPFSTRTEAPREYRPKDPRVRVVYLLRSAIFERKSDKELSNGLLREFAATAVAAARPALKPKPAEAQDAKGDGETV